MIFEPGSTYTNGRERRVVEANDGATVAYIYPVSRRRFTAPVDAFQSWFDEGGAAVAVPLWPDEAIALQRALSAVEALARAMAGDPEQGAA